MLQGWICWIFTAFYLLTSVGGGRTDADRDVVGREDGNSICETAESQRNKS